MTSNPLKKLQFKIMKKSSKLASIVLAASFLGTAIPVNTNSTFTEKDSLEKTSLESRVNGQPDTIKVYSYNEISKMVHDVYRKTRSKPDYLSERFVREIIAHESSYNPMATSEKGARGLMQLMPDTWGDFEKTSNYDEYAFDPRTNLKVGMKYILFLDRFCRNNHQEWEELTPIEKRNIILASYNGGISRLNGMGWDIDSMPKETKSYVKNIGGKMK